VDIDVMIVVVHKTEVLLINPIAFLGF